MVGNDYLVPARVFWNTSKLRLHKDAHFKTMPCESWITANECPSGQRWYDVLYVLRNPECPAMKPRSDLTPPHTIGLSRPATGLTFGMSCTERSWIWLEYNSSTAPRERTYPKLRAFSHHDYCCQAICAREMPLFAAHRGTLVRHNSIRISQTRGDQSTVQSKQFGTCCGGETPNT